MAETSQTDVRKALAQVQQVVSVPKSRHNDFGGFDYRSLEDIVAALKEPCEAAGISYTLDDEVVSVGDRYYVKATCTVFADGCRESVSTSAYAREAEHKKGSDDAQVTGMASSYARKYALCGMFAIDGGGDPDAAAPAKAPAKEPPESGPFVAHCRSCGTRYQFPDRASYEQFAAAPGCCPSPMWEVE
jgi:hypothetical protein